MIAIALLILGAAPAEEIAGKPYERLATREATEVRMRELLQPAPLRFGEAFVLAPFPYAGFDKRELARPEEVESELAHLSLIHI